MAVQEVIRHSAHDLIEKQLTGEGFISVRDRHPALKMDLPVSNANHAYSSDEVELLLNCGHSVEGNYCADVNDGVQSYWIGPDGDIYLDESDSEGVTPFVTHWKPIA